MVRLRDCCASMPIRNRVLSNREAEAWKIIDQFAHRRIQLSITLIHFAHSHSLSITIDHYRKHTLPLTHSLSPNSCFGSLSTSN